MKRLIIIIIVLLSIVETVKSQNDSTTFRRWEIGAEYNWDHKFYVTEWVWYGHTRKEPEWIYCLYYDFKKNPRNYIAYGAYFNYKIFSFLSLNSQIYYRKLKIGFNETDSWLSYKDSLYHVTPWNYEFQSIEFPICMTISFFNRFFINPYISGGGTNNICVFEKALIHNNGLEFYKNKHWEYYSFRLRYGGGVNLKVGKLVSLGCDVYITTRPLWQTDKTMLTGISYSNFSVGLHAGYLIK